MENQLRVRLEPRADNIAVIKKQGSITHLGAILRSTIKDPDAVIAIRDGYLVTLSHIRTLIDTFNPDIHNWDPGLEAIGRLKHRIVQDQLSAKIEVAQALETPYDSLKDYEETWRLDPHQVEAVAAMTVPSLQGMALFDEQGAGKTLCALATFHILRRRDIVSHLLVVAPKSVLAVWKDEINNFLKNQYKVKIAVGKGARPIDMLQSEADILLISYETAIRTFSILQGLISTKGRAFMLVVDESYYIKNPVAQRSRAVSKLRQQCKRAYVLCGAPVPNSPADIVHQMDVADAGSTFSGVSIPDDKDSAAAVVQVALGISAIYLRRLKEEVLPELPAKSIKKTFVRLQPMQAKMYEDAVNKLIVDVRQVDDMYFRKHLNEFMARKWALLQICSNPMGLDPTYAEVPAKLLAIDQIIEKIVKGQGHKIIIWSFFRRSLQAIFDRYKYLGAVRIDGSIDSLDERHLSIHRFQEDPSIKVFVGNPAAAGAGITLTAASNAIFESFSNQPAHYLQSVDRIHRRGQQNPVTSYVLLSQTTIEGREYDRFLEKERRGHDIFRKWPHEPATKEGFLKDLLVT